MQREPCACLVPFFNERDRIHSVLAVASLVSGLSPIICIDDGSTDGGASLVQEQFADVALVRLAHNQGKTGAIRAGLRLVRSEYVCLLDADLRGLNALEIEAALKRMAHEPGIDMLILRRVHAALHSKIIRGDVLYTGERILRTRDLLQVLARRPKSYQLELAINQYMLEQHKRVYWMPSSAQNTFKVNKVGWVPGLRRELLMMKNMLDYAGFEAYAKQFFGFAWERAPERPTARLIEFWGGQR